MAFENPVSTFPGLEAAADLSTHQFKFVKVTANRRVNITGAGEQAIGVLQDDPDAAGKSAAVWGPGSTSKVVAGAAVTAGDKVMSDATGRAITATSTNFINGVAIEAAAGAGAVITVLLVPGGKL